ncbi:SRPBCC family protein [Frigoribacterium sp. VKM Ac-1396]|uniref:SRPBCC family protein n=1 Tax=Frigoribacterium sp. VKM Ac-1396 TaxID=2783821 RepID=UPI00188DB35C|nr:SRPBCC family protein [Frigoribacterium sp. VKM Ac-1396]MBF4599301.1 SRPBCC family protein [Frigoribacterium sp. VKM Ac-1396]
MTWPVVHISRSLDHDVAAVSSVAGNPANLPAWAAGLSSGIRQEDGRWITDSPMGVVEVAFTGPVELGILDHDVTVPDGSVVRNSFRVVANDQGTEAIFTLFRRDGMSEADFQSDADAVRSDLDRLAVLLDKCLLRTR